MNNTLQILIVEDELLISEMLKEILLELGHKVVAQVKTYASACNELEANPFIDFVITDINLNEEKTGIDIGDLVKNKYKIPFMYLTSYSDSKTIQTAAQTSPSNYLIKPFTKGDVLASLIVVQPREIGSGKAVIIKDGHLSVKVFVKDICCVQSENNYISIQTPEKKYVVRNSLEKFMEELNSPNFIRTHRSYVVNILKVNAINGQYVLIGELKVPLSRKHRDDVLTLFSE